VLAVQISVQKGNNSCRNLHGNFAYSSGCGAAEENPISASEAVHASAWLAARLTRCP
jgi:hypothetical protein